MTSETGGSLPEEPLAYRAVRGGLWVAASSYFNTGFGFVANLLLTRILMPDDYGVFALALAFSSFLSIRSMLGYGRAFAQRRETNGALLGTHLGLDAAAGFSSLLLAGVAVPILRVAGYSWDVVWVLLALAGMDFLRVASRTIGIALDKELYFGQASLVSSVVMVLSYLPAFWLALNGGGYWSLVAQMAAFVVLGVTGTWWLGRRKLPHLWRIRWRFDPPIAVELLRFGVTVGLAGMTGVVVGRFDDLLVGTFVGVTTLGFYDRAFRIAQWPSLLLHNVTTRTLFYTYARLQDDPERLRKTVSLALWLIAMLSLPLALAIIASAPDLVGLLYGNRWRPSAPFVRLLVADTLLHPFLNNASSLFVAVGQPRKGLIVGTVHAVTLIAIATPLTLIYGAMGTCVGVALSYIVPLIVAWHYMRQIVPISLQNVLAWPAVAALLSAAAYLLLAQSVDLNLLPLAVRVMVKAGTVSGVYLLAMMAIQPRQQIERFSYICGLLRGGT